MDTKEIGEKLVAYCREGKNMEAIEELYSDDIVSVEAMSGEAMPAEMRGKDAIRGKNQWWIDNHEIHGSSTEGPFPHHDKFAVRFNFDITPKGDLPQAGQRTQMEEIAVYTVQDGKIVREEFYYAM